MNALLVKVMVIDDDSSQRKPVAKAIEGLSNDSYKYLAAPFASGMDALLEKNILDFDIAIIDQNMPSPDGFETAKSLLIKHPNIICYMLTAFANPEKQSTAMGLYSGNIKCFHGYIDKPADPIKLDNILKSPIVVQRIKIKQYSQQQICADAKVFLVGQTRAIKDLKARVELLAAAPDLSALILGESGSGKELVAKLLHALTPERKSKRLMAIDCSAISVELFESEMFGVMPGIINGQTKLRKGKLDEANGGTLLLDEIQNLSLYHQQKLLRVLQERSFQRVGGTEDIKFNVRVVAIANENLLQKVESGDFREDLYYRVCQVPLYVPPLRNRKEDIPLLAEHFFEKHAPGVNFSNKDELMPEINSYEWSNVRDLENAIARTAGLAKDFQLDRSLLFLDVKDWKFKSNSVDIKRELTPRVQCPSEQALATSPSSSLTETDGVGALTLDQAAKQIRILRNQLHPKLAGSEGQIMIIAEEIKGLCTDIWEKAVNRTIKKNHTEAVAHLYEDILLKNENGGVKKEIEIERDKTLKKKAGKAVKTEIEIERDRILKIKAGKAVSVIDDDKSYVFHKILHTGLQKGMNGNKPYTIKQLEAKLAELRNKLTEITQGATGDSKKIRKEIVMLEAQITALKEVADVGSLVNV